MKNIILTGEKGIGKSSVIKSFIEKLNEEYENEHIYGFCTQKVDSNNPQESYDKVYIYPANGQLIQSEEFCVADINKEKAFKLHSNVFEQTGCSLLSDIPSGSIICMDELGFIEGTCNNFCQSVMNVLNSDCFVIAVIKEASTPFLNDIRNHEKTILINVNEENRNKLPLQIYNLYNSKVHNAKYGVI